MSVYFKTSGNEIYVDPDNNTIIIILLSRQTDAW